MKLRFNASERNSEMDTSEDLPKKVFKARKTMRASDRQQLEAIYKSREELLKANEETKTKLCNGRHENGDSDNKSSLNTNCMDDTDIDGINDVRLGPEELQSHPIDELNIAQTHELNCAEKCLDEDGDINSQDEKMDLIPLLAKDEQISTGSTETHILDVQSKVDDIVEPESVELKQDSLLADKSGSDSHCPSEKERPASVSDSRSQKISDETSLTLQLSSSSVREKEDHESSLDISEEAITSSIESVQEKNNCESSKLECTEIESEIATKDKLNENKLAENNQLEIEEIIPILEKLAPEKDADLSSNQGIIPAVDSPSPKDSSLKDLQEEPMDTSPCSSPTKEECNGNLPEEAFLVLSDEDEPIIENKTESEELAPKNDEPDTDHIKQAAETRQKQEPNNCQYAMLNASIEPVSSMLPDEVVPRKRSKSEDMESSISKRCRFSGDEYEAALKVKITARGEIRNTLEKIVQQIIEERISAMQSGVFDKKLAELKNRVEKIECNTRHESLISGLQAKLMQIEKRLGSANQARNDSSPNKTQENSTISTPQQSSGPQTTQPVSPSKSNNPSLGASGSVPPRSGTVRQMLDLRRNMADSVACGQQSANSSSTGITNLSPPQVVGGQTKPQNAGTSGAVVTPVLPATAAVVGNSPSLPTSGSNQPMPVSLQSVPVLLTVPVAMSSQPQLLQASANSLMTNQQPGIEILPVQSQPMLNNLSKPLPSQASANVAKATGASTSLPSPGVQRKSPGSVGSVQISNAASSQTTTVTSTQSTVSPQISRTTQPSLVSPGHFSPPHTRPPIQPRPSQTYSQGQVSGSPSQPLTISSDSISAGTSRSESSLSQATTQRHPVAAPVESPTAKKAPPSGNQLSEKTVSHSPLYTYGIFDGNTLLSFEDQMTAEQIANNELLDGARRHVSVTEEDLIGLEEERNEKNTRKQTDWAVNILKQWLIEKGRDENFEMMPVEELNSILREFYGTVRNHDGNTYSISSYKSIRAGLNRHLKMPPHSRQICLMQDKEFSSANNVFLGVLKILRKQGKDETNHHPPINAADLRKIRISGVLGLHTPLALVNKVWFDLQLHFAKRGREILRDLPPDAFAIKRDPNGRRYAVLKYTGKSRSREDPLKLGRMYDMPGDVNCPVTSLELYISKLPPDPPAFYLHPLKLTPEQLREQSVWYKREPMGVNYLGSMMPRISIAARLSQRYTNHSLRTTTVRLLCDAGLGAREIMALTGHRSESSIRNYWGAAEFQYRAWSDMLDNAGFNYIYTTPSSVSHESRSAASSSTVTLNHNSVSGKNAGLILQNYIIKQERLK
ncbi:activating transcription factor 7-interacting protein 1-like isoform X3 [Chiloscyllium plagiosum]|uniref:activating transcription factor 7-interacting protein 1-like isoform X3 n=1 Tax=Chiloscyllium plagiosum TaxID=36176 RepID=UPI001CB808B8|nr:activating transcription factor 7-interacting protein 1-like isoform X3 [Chiloscyllium plagiosum]